MDQVSNILNEDRNELIKLTRPPPLLDYLRLRNQDHTNSPLHSAGTEKESLVSRANSSSTIPVDLNVRLASVVNTRTHFSSVSLFDQNRHPLFMAERAETEADAPMIVPPSDFLSHQPQPYDPVWPTSAV